MNFLTFFKNKTGFSLIELLVVISIGTVILTSVIIQQNKWNDKLSVDTQAYELALMIRQAQIYGLGVRQYAPSTGDQFNIGYGVYFTQDHLDSYIFFADNNGNLKYDAGEEIETKTFNRGVTISTVCGNNRCFPGGGPLAQVGIVFFRPEPKANMSLLNAGGNTVDNPPVTINLCSSNPCSSSGTISSVKAEANGQVSIIQ
jgi:prepilin-type N-terminal cleavage/methylation domain-containing protein